MLMPIYKELYKILGLSNDHPHYKKEIWDFIVESLKDKYIEKQVLFIKFYLFENKILSYDDYVELLQFIIAIHLYDEDDVFKKCVDIFLYNSPEEEPYLAPFKFMRMSEVIIDFVTTKFSKFIGDDTYTFCNGEILQDSHTKIGKTVGYLKFIMDKEQNKNKKSGRK